jgi:tetratricopeptide (TPR) repeat protein
MLQRSLPIGSFFGAAIKLHWSLLLALGYFYIQRSPEDSWEWLELVLQFLMLFVSVALHEFGHLLAARLFGIRTKSVVLWALGGFALFEQPPRRPLHQLVISAAGPLTNLLLGLLTGGLLLLAITWHGPDWEFLLWEALNYFDPLLELPGLVFFLILINIVLAIVNLLPIYPLDGGKIAQALLQIFGLPQRWVNRITVAVSMVLGLSWAAYAISGGNWIDLFTISLVLLGAATLIPSWQQAIILWLHLLIDRPTFHFLRGDYALAVAGYDRILARDPRNVNAYHNRAAAHHMLGNFAQAFADYAAAIAIEPAHAKLFADRSMVYADQQSYAEAFADVERATTLGHDQVALHRLRGQYFMDCNEYHKASAEFAQAVQLAPDQPALSAYHALNEWQAGGDDATLLATLDKALKQAPGDPEIYIIRSYAAMQRRDLTTARSEVEKALATKNRPYLYGAYINRAHILLYSGDAQAALRDYDTILAIAARWGKVFIERGIAHAQLGDYAGALANFEKAIARLPREPETYIQRAKVYWLTGELALAQADIAAAIALDPEHALLHEPAWLYYNLVGQQAWAEQYYAWASAALPESPLPYLGRGNALRLNEAYEEAFADYEQAIALDPQRADGYLGRGLIYLHWGQSEQAQADFAMARACNPQGAVLRQLNAL